jgi:hypothetical protein
METTQQRMETTRQPTPIRELIAELAATEDVLRGCRAGSPSARHRAARLRQGQIVTELRRRPVAVR